MRHRSVSATAVIALCSATMFATSCAPRQTPPSSDLPHEDKNSSTNFTSVSPPSTPSSAQSLPSSTARSTPPTKKPLFTRVGQIPEDADLIGNEDGVFAVNNRWDARSVTSYSLTGEIRGTLNYELSAGVAVEAGCTTFLLEHKPFPRVAMLSNVQKPPTGIQPGKVEYFVSVYDGEDMRQVWKKKVFEEEGDSSYVSCNDGELPMSVTEDGKWIVVPTSNGLSFILDAETGGNRTVESRAAAAGNYLVATQDWYEQITTLDPATLAPLHHSSSTTESSSPKVTDILDDFFDGSGRTIDGRRVLSRDGNNLLDLANGTASTGPIFHGSLSSRIPVVTESISNRVYINTFTPNSEDYSPGFGATAYDLSSNEALWMQPHIEDICGASPDSVLVRAGSQLAVLSAENGEQISHTAALSSCDPVFGEFMYVSDDNQGSIGIYRVLE